MPDDPTNPDDFRIPQPGETWWTKYSVAFVLAVTEDPTTSALVVTYYHGGPESPDQWEAAWLKDFISQFSYRPGLSEAE